MTKPTKQQIVDALEELFFHDCLRIADTLVRKGLAEEPKPDFGPHWVQWGKGSVPVVGHYSNGEWWSCCSSAPQGPPHRIIERIRRPNEQRESPFEPYRSST